jgi:hypothetical protein
VPSPSDKRLLIAAVLYPVVQSFLFGASVVLVAAGLADHAGLLLPYAALFSLVMAAPLAWEIAPVLSLELSGRDRLSRFRAGQR